MTLAGNVLGCDTGLANGGYAIVSPRGVVLEIDVVVTKPDHDLKIGVDRRRRLGLHRERILELVHEHNVVLMAAESIRLPAGRTSIDASASAFMTWAMLDTVASLIGVELVEVSPQQWQRAILPNEGAGQLDYARVYIELEKYVIAQKREQLLEIPRSKREHALDGCGCGIYAALERLEAPVVHAQIDEREQHADRMALHWATVVEKLRKGAA